MTPSGIDIALYEIRRYLDEVNGAELSDSQHEEVIKTVTQSLTRMGSDKSLRCMWSLLAVIVERSATRKALLLN
jgi:hypothetical protein